MYVNQNIGALDRICASANVASLGTVVDLLVDDLTNKIPYSGDLLSEGQVEATINSEAFTIDVTMPNGADVTELVATFTISDDATISVGAIEQVSGITANDFTDPIIYSVTSESGDVVNDWTVTVTVSET